MLDNLLIEAKLFNSIFKVKLSISFTSTLIDFNKQCQFLIFASLRFHFLFFLFQLIDFSSVDKDV